MIRDSQAEDDAYALWAELWPVVRVFLAMRTQWRAGPAGVIGMDYAALDRCGEPLPRRRRSFMEDLRTMELAALQP